MIATFVNVTLFFACLGLTLALIAAVGDALEERHGKGGHK